RQPAHDSASYRISQRVFLMLVVKRVESRHGHFGLPQITGRCFLLPKFVSPPKIQKVVAADTGIRRGEPGRHGCEREECLIHWVGGGAVIMVEDVATQPVFPLASEAKIPFESRSSALRIAGKGLMNLLVGEVCNAAEPACDEKIHTGLPTVDVSISTLDRL